MKLLLVGFSEQNVRTLKFFCHRNFKEFECLSVERHFSNNMRLTLPELTPNQKSCDAYMIFLDGVGMSSYRLDYVEALKGFIGNTPSLLVTRNDMHDWQQAPCLKNRNVLYLGASYSQQTIRKKFEALLRLVDAHHSSKLYNKTLIKIQSDVDSQGLDDNSDSGHVIEPSINSTDDTDPSISNFSQQRPVQQKSSQKKSSQQAPSKAALTLRHAEFEILYQRVLYNPQTEPVDRTLRLYFPNLYDLSLIRNILAIKAQTSPLKVAIGAHEFYVYNLQQHAIARRDLDRLMDFVSVVGRYLFVDAMKITITEISITQYEKITNNAKDKGYKSYSLPTLLWQLTDVALQKEFAYNEHNLNIKVNILPNFAVISNTPNYVYPVLAACLTKPRRISQLQSLFPELSIQALNRIVVIAMLTGILDTSVLLEPESASSSGLSSVGGGLKTLTAKDTMVASTEEPVKDNNKNVNKARQTGFLQRLLNKLSL